MGFRSRCLRGAVRNKWTPLIWRWLTLIDRKHEGCYVATETTTTGASGDCTDRVTLVSNLDPGSPSHAVQDDHFAFSVEILPWFTVYGYSGDRLGFGVAKAEDDRLGR
jgi:hypothetical protein